MDIVIHCMGMPFNGETIYKQSLGGSETAAYYQARELAKRGHRVCVFTTSRDQGEWDGVRYCFIGEPSQASPLGESFEHYALHTPFDVLIIQRHPLAFHKQYQSKVNIWQLHDLALLRTTQVANFGMWQLDAVTGVSQWHRKQIAEVYGFDERFVKSVPNGVDPDLYQSPLPNGIALPEGVEALRASGKTLLLFQSRPERGLENLVAPNGIMDQLADTDAHLLVCAYANTVPQMEHYYARLEAEAKARGNVTMLGALTKPQLATLQRSVDLLVYPTAFEEVSCISVMEAMHAGLPVLTSIVGALPETCMDAGVRFIKLNKDDSVNVKAFASEIRSFMARPQLLEAMKGAQLKAAKFKTWSAAVDKLEAVIEDAFQAKRGSSGAIARHCIEHSDLDLWDNFAPKDRNGVVYNRTSEEVTGLYAFRASQAAYAEHYAKHQGVYYDDHEERVIGEDVTLSTRYRASLMFVAEGLRKAGERPKVLDYGCAHGHYLVPLAKTFPQATFVGVDVSKRAIEAAKKWLERDKITNAFVCEGTEDTLQDVVAASSFDGEPELFDVVFAGEVLEHAIDWRLLLNKFREVLKPGGIIVITTPHGRWEWTGTEAFRTGREHLVQFERQDIVEICGANEYQIIHAPATHDRTGKSLGSWVWMCRPTQEFGEIDYARKVARLAPRQTVSACLIVKDGEKTLRKCVESFADWVDEIIIGIDPATKDRTKQIAQQLADDYSLKPFTIFDGLEALKEGFDAARNATIKRACGEWILWCDADEEIQQPWNIWKYLRNSQHDGIGFPQVHYSTNPPSVLTTDYPIRLFRNKPSIQFYGVVHEHPETEPGKSIPFATVRHDVQFLHSGYVDEETRRARFMRNLPLLHRDIEKYPDRGLNRFLWLRDIAQSLAFEQEQTGGYVVEGQVERAMEGVRMFEKMLDKDPVRMVVEVLKYYSHCVAVTGRGFNVKMAMATQKDEAPDLKVNVASEGRFYSKAHFDKFMIKIQEESTKHYESKYL